MALVKYGGGIVQMTGSIAGNTYARNRYGNYARARTKPINPNTASQQGIRSTMSQMVERWNDALDAVQRAAWKLYADNVAMKNRLGETIHLSGFNHYVRSNIFRAYAGVDPVDDGPTVFSLPQTDATIADVIDETNQKHSFSFDIDLDWNKEDKALLVLYIGMPQMATRNFFAGPWKWNFKITGVAPEGNASPKTAGVAYPVAEGQKIWIYCRIARADGRLSSKFGLVTTVIA